MNKEHYEKLIESSVAEWNLHVKKCREKDSGWRADLKRADLRGVDLSRANLSNTNLQGADLRFADLKWAHLEKANLQEAHYTIPQMLRANWGACSNELTLQLMRLNAEALPNGCTLMDTWAREIDGPCPFNDVCYKRVAIFEERRAVWKRGRPKSLWEIWKMLAEEKGLKIDK